MSHEFFWNLLRTVWSVLMLPTQQGRQHLTNVVLDKLQLQCSFLTAHAVTLFQHSSQVKFRTASTKTAPLKSPGAPECKSAKGDPAEGDLNNLETG